MLTPRPSPTTYDDDDVINAWLLTLTKRQLGLTYGHDQRTRNAVDHDDGENGQHPGVVAAVEKRRRHHLPQAQRSSDVGFW